MKKMNGNLVDSGFYYTKKIPIRIVEIDENKLYPVKYEYKAYGYKGLIFSARMSEIEITSKE